jgi:hypothetical protein
MRLIVRLACCLLLAACQAATPERSVSDRFSEIRTRPPELSIFLRQMPKGGDLHNHLSGAIYAESYIAWAIQANLCVNLATWTFESQPPCDTSKGRPSVADYTAAPDLRARLINALSMREYVPGQGMPSAHDQFFVAFSRFGAAGDGRIGDMLAEVSTRAAAQNINYLELMVTFRGGDARTLGNQVGWDGNTATTRAKLLQAGLPALIPQAQRDLDEMERARRAKLGCDVPATPPACLVTIRYIAQVIRTLPIQQVFAQTALAFELIRAEPRIVGLNYVAPEDFPVALNDYEKHMVLLRDLSQILPGTPLSLHAGELTMGLVPPQDLRFHIRQAVTIAGARRIGHGIDIVYEDDATGLLRTMRERDVLVEINLTSNDVILGVRGKHHPFELYRRAGVPVALSTDDEGVSRVDLTHEFQRAVETYDLSYADIKGLARNSLTYSFLPGDSLWSDSRRGVIVAACADAPPGGSDLSQHKACADFLARSEKARQQWRLESEFDAFEKSIVAGP